MTIGIDCRSIEGERTGVGRILINLLRVWAQEQNNHRFVLYFKHAVPNDVFLQSNKFVLKRLKPMWGRESNALFEHLLLPLALKKDEIDILYAPAYTAPFFSSVPCVVTIHDISYEVHPEWFSGYEQVFRRIASRRAAVKARKVITVSEFSRSEVIKHYSLDPEKVVRVYQPAIVDQTLSSEREAVPLPDKPFVLCVGTIFNRRHVPELIEAVALANQSEPVSLVLVGRDATIPPQNIASLIKNVNAQAGSRIVSHFDYIPDEKLAYLYDNCLALALLSEYEGFGMPLLEAMALGKPAIIAPGSSLTEVSGGAALVTNPEDFNVIAADILRLLKDEDLRAELSGKGIKRAGEFDFDLAAKQTLSVIENAFNS